MAVIFPHDRPGPDTGFTALRTDRLVVRRFTAADLPAFVAYRSDPAIARYQGWDAPYPVQRAERMLAELDQQHPDTPGCWFQFAVALATTDGLVGDCGVFVPIDRPRQAELGFTFAAQHHGRGYATEAVRRVLDYLFLDRGKHRVVASCDDRNVRSAALLRRVGMRREGLQLQSTWSKGGWTNDELYAVLHHEWPAGSSHP
jgi:aminoglycoside 6'-N-acetyltransferase